MCPQCGTTYLPKDTISEENFEPKFDSNNKTRIFTAKKKKKYYDKQGNEINDETLLNDIAQGSKVIYYNEVKSGEDTIIDNKNRRIIRSDQS